MAKIKTFIAIIFSTTFAACLNNTKKTSNKIVLSVDSVSLKNFKWTDLLDTSKTKVYYLQLNFLNFPDDNFIGKDIIDFKDSIPNNSFLLDSRQRQELLELISDSSNFSGGDCGTFHLNSGIVVAHKDKINATINIGCGFNQWNFSPENPVSKYGSFNEKGFKQMEKLLDNINLTNQK